MKPEFQSLQPGEASKKRHDPSSQLFENWNRQTRRGDESAGVRRGGEKQQKVGARAGCLGGEQGEVGKGEVGSGTRRWAGKGPEAAGNSQPHARRPSVRSPKATSEALPLPSPRLPPPAHRLGLGERWGKMPDAKK